MSPAVRSPAVLALLVEPDPKTLPAVRAALRRWLLLHGLGAKRKVIELLTSELLARAVIDSLLHRYLKRLSPLS